MTILMLNSYGVSCKKDHEHLIIEKTMKTDDGAPTIKRYQQPVTNLTGVIAETGIYLSPGALTLLLQQTIPIIWMNKHELVGMAHGFAGSGTVITRRAQFKAFDDDRGIHLAKRFVIGGLYNKANLLLSYAKNRPDNGGENIKHEVLKIREIAQQVLSLKEENQLDKTRGILMALEAQGARIYHSELIKLIPEEYRFVKRTRRPPKDPINAALSYGYAILNARCLLAIIGTGLDPYGGYLHVDRSGRTSLAIDLAEEFRQLLVDRVVVTKAIRKEFDPEKHFDNEPGGVYLNTKGKELLITAIEERFEIEVDDPAGKIKLRGMMLRQARRIIHYLLGKTSEYKPFVGDW